MKYILICSFITIIILLFIGICQGLECLNCDEVLHGVGHCNISSDIQHHVTSCDAVCYKAIGAMPKRLQKHGCISLSPEDKLKYVGKCVKAGEFLQRELDEINYENAKNLGIGAEFVKLAEFCACDDKDACNGGNQQVLSHAALGLFVGVVGLLAVPAGRI